ncbi:hypothetical protein LAZ67_13001167 [Cordylochernes scorpioides]|uniref:Uncharacterized protein n=1 Tax=Cordylochernes scorpioides TaxID=51811 RepID=A0ABY6L734_9ARAC|nr:hypothetical protein LAZ67_13001167 [Cordylochernes scorpioides]
MSYWKIKIDEEDRGKTAFITLNGLFVFKVMAFELCNTHRTFERMMDSLLKGLKKRLRKRHLLIVQLKVAFFFDISNNGSQRVVLDLCSCGPLLGVVGQQAAQELALKSHK